MNHQAPPFRPQFCVSREIFLRALGVSYFCAFFSFLLQASTLIGQQGLLPATDFLSSIFQKFGNEAFLLLPSVFWLGSSDAVLNFVCLCGVVLSLCLILGILPVVSTFFLWFLYLSLVNVSGVFMGYQWDMLLLETGFVSIFICPRCLLLRRARDREPHILVVMVLRLIVFKLMFSSGLVKLLSEDPTWKDLSALQYHYFTQPLPHIVSWYVAKLPDWFHQLSVACVLIIELLVPCLIFLSQRTRHFAALCLILFQLLILATGNFGFFNILTISLCFLLIDDSGWARVLQRREYRPASKSFNERARKVPRFGRNLLAVIVASLFLLGNARWYFGDLFRTPLLAEVQKLHDGFRLTSTYGLFAVMTTVRNEIIVDGSADGNDWKEYQFRWKPGDPSKPPQWAGPHMPRLDWQMWFAALGHPEAPQNVFLQRLLYKISSGDIGVEDFFTKNPFPGAAPKYVRASLWNYTFSNRQERESSGQWWKRRRIRSLNILSRDSR